MEPLVRISELELEMEQGVKATGRVVWLEECGSTMDVARALRTELPHQGLSLIATEHQNAGRGRQGRGWSSIRGAFQGTFICPLQSEPVPAATLVVGIAVHDALASLGIKVKLKWPNDIVSSGERKLGGILTELIAHPTAYLIGVGVNLLGANSNLSEARIGSIEAEYGVRLTPVQFATALWPILERNIAVVQESGFGGFQERWMQSAAFIGADFLVEQGAEQIAGSFVGVDSAGALLLEQCNVTRAITSGHILKIRTKHCGSD